MYLAEKTVNFGFPGVKARREDHQQQVENQVADLRKGHE